MYSCSSVHRYNNDNRRPLPGKAMARSIRADMDFSRKPERAGNRRPGGTAAVAGTCGPPGLGVRGSGCRRVMEGVSEDGPRSSVITIVTIVTIVPPAGIRLCDQPGGEPAGVAAAPREVGLQDSSSNQAFSFP